MKVLVTGSKGFIGRNLIKQLEKNSKVDEIMEYDRGNSFEELEDCCKKADAVFHLAAVLRPENISGFDDNIDLTSRLLNYLSKYGNKSPVMFASSIQADQDNPYGQCKRIEEEKLINYGKDNYANAFIFRFPNLFGTMSRPNYTSVVATFCYNTVKNLPIVVNNPAAVMHFAFIEVIAKYVISVVFSNDDGQANKILQIEDFYSVELGELAYYMGTLKSGSEPKINRDDDFYKYLKITFDWYAKNAYLFE